MDICRKHQTPLVQKCPYCNELNTFNCKSRVGYCNNCNYWLGVRSDGNYQTPVINDEWHNWIYDNIGQLLTVLPIQKGVTLNQFRKNIRKISSMKSIAKEINVSYVSIYNWRKGKPCLTDVLGLSFIVGYSVHDLLTEDIDTFTNVFLNRRIIKKNKNYRNKTDIKELKKALDEAIISNNGVSLAKLSIQVNIKIATIKKYFPKEVEILKENYNKFKQVQK